MIRRARERRGRVMLAAVAAGCLCAHAAAQEAQDAPAPDAEPRPGGASQEAPDFVELTPDLRRAVARGMAALAALQREDGSFGGQRYPRNTGITALAAIAFLADGHVPGRGEYGEVVERATEFILDSAAETGLIAADVSHGPMYGHGFATLFLGEVYGMTRGGPDTEFSDRVHDALVRAVRLIVQTQNDEGGWRYNPVPHDADVSVTICQIMALRSANNAGIRVFDGEQELNIKQTIDRAVEYVKLCQNPDGGFRYQSRAGNSAWPRSAAGVASLFYAGIYEGQSVDEGMAYLMRNAMPGGGRSQAHYFYGQYYTAQTMFLAGGEYWAEWFPAARAELVERQQDDGTWADASAGTAYGTAMALIVLQMPKRYLPIFQE